MEHIETFAGGATLLYTGWVARSWWVRDSKALEFQRMVSLAAGAVFLACLIYQGGILRGAEIVADDLSSSVDNIVNAAQEKLGPIQRSAEADDRIKKHSEALISRLILPIGILFDLGVIWLSGTVITWFSRTRFNYDPSTEPGEANNKRSGASPK